MPRIKDLGINIVPGTMRPPEIGGGGGGCRRSMWMNECTQCTPDSGIAPTDDGCQCITSDDCGRITCGYSCNHMTREMETDDGCQCVTGGNPTDDGCQCITSMGCGRWTCVRSACHVSRTTNVTPHTPRLPAGALSRDQIAALRTQLRQQLANLDVAEKNSLPKTLEEVDAREKEIQAELEMLKKHRDTLKKKK